MVVIDDGRELRLAQPLRSGVSTLGFGTRAAIWLQGCPHACEGCMAEETWDPNGGSVRRVDDLVRDISADVGADGLTISGGEPFTQPSGLLALLAGVRAQRSHEHNPFDILVYSGFTRTVVERRWPEVLELVDVLVDGVFIADRASEELPWRGSGNQVLHVISEDPVVNERYRDAGTERPHPPLQLLDLRRRGDGGIDAYLAGVPRPGDLARFEEELAARMRSTR